MNRIIDKGRPKIQYNPIGSIFTNEDSRLPAVK